MNAHPEGLYMSPQHTLALYYAEKFQWSIFPVTPGKKAPPIKGWQTKSTNNPKIIDKFWSKHPTYNIGLDCGKSDMFVVDCDLKVVIVKQPDGSEIERTIDGLAGLKALEEKYGPLPTALRARTPRGGMHIYLRNPQKLRNSASKIAEGIDCRGVGGYVLLPGSVIDGVGVYSWL
jgi:hypothetical protein